MKILSTKRYKQLKSCEFDNNILSFRLQLKEGIINFWYNKFASIVQENIKLRKEIERLNKEIKNAK